MGRRGPTPKGEYAGKSEVFSTRIRPDLRASLEKAAEASGRSISQEVEHRLRRTFIQDERIEDAFGSRENYLILRIAGLAMQYARIPFRRVSNWTADPLSFDVVVKAVNGVLEAIRPPSTERREDPKTDATADFVSKQIPAALWRAIQQADPALALDKGTRDEHLAGLLKSELGDIVGRPDLRVLDENDLRELAKARGWQPHTESAQVTKSAKKTSPTKGKTTRPREEESE